jgi:acyl carrier protein
VSVSTWGELDSKGTRIVGAEQTKAREVINQFLGRAGKSRDPLTDDVALYGDGLELDSLEVAELSALLEDELGSDPFSADGDMPETVGEILAFYPAA